MRRMGGCLAPPQQAARAVARAVCRGLVALAGVLGAGLPKPGPRVPCQARHQGHAGPLPMRYFPAGVPIHRASGQTALARANGPVLPQPRKTPYLIAKLNKV